MKLNTTQIDRIQEEVGLTPVPEADPVQAQLEEHFGAHTFYVDTSGLYVWEAVGEPELAEPQAVALRVASWANEEKTLLESHEPRATGNLVSL